jgi:proteic killer suppression protein
MAVKNYKNELTKAIASGESPKGFPSDLVKVARRKLGYLDAATRLDDLKAPPGNRLHALTKDREGQHAIWVNDKYRVCFTWTEQGPTDVEIVDYH